MKNILLALSALSISLLAPMAAASQENAAINATTQSPVYNLDDKVVLGRVESVYLNDIEGLKGISFAGKIDTGADTTSMHATDIHVTSSDPQFSHLKDHKLMKALIDFDPIDKVDYHDWDAELFAPYGVEVTFTVQHPHTGEEIEITRPIERVGVIRNRTQKEPILRPTITLPMTIAGKTVETQVNLTDRNQFSAPILIGKTFLDNNA